MGPATGICLFRDPVSHGLNAPANPGLMRRLLVVRFARLSQTFGTNRPNGLC